MYLMCDYNLILKHYAQPEAAGYRGWLETPTGEIVAFMRLDGSIQWRW